MKKTVMFLAVLMCAAGIAGRGPAAAQEAVIRIKDSTLMNEVRAWPSPQNGEYVSVNPPRFMWPDRTPDLGPVLDGAPAPEVKKEDVLYRIRIARDMNFTENMISGEQAWAFFNPFRILADGQWYWQYAFVDPDGREEWSEVLTFYIDKGTPMFSPPSFTDLTEALSPRHPRILLDADRWEEVMLRNIDSPDARYFIRKADKCLGTPLLRLDEEIDTSMVVTQTNEVQRKSVLIRESRKIVDREEPNVEALVRAYLLTGDEKYRVEGMARLREMLSWQDSRYLAGDFNRTTMLSLCTSAYDGFYNLLTQEEKDLLTDNIRSIGGKFFGEYVNHLENRIADNHVWQMGLRILTMAAFATLGEIDEASVWADYCYNQWVSRFPGLNDDGAWHNGDSYFHVNIRTLVEVPALYTRLTGFNFFADPWYEGNALYVIYQQPPFSMSGGHGNSHESMLRPNAARVGYADALARECGNPMAAAYEREILAEDPDILVKGSHAKAGDLAWYRCVTDKPLPETATSLADLPCCKVFPQTGTALMHTDIGHHDKNATLSFRSSPYGSTSHALANQNSFNTFYGGKPVFYSSGHRTGFSDAHCMYAYRNTRAHNTLLINGKSQKIGTEGYGWIPRRYEGERISYVVGDASNAYGPEESALWLERGRLSGIEYTPENGWDENRLSFFRRHVVQLGRTGLFVIYDELEADEPVEWSYLLHTLDLPMEVTATDGLTIKGRNSEGGVSVAHLYCSEKMNCEQTDTFFVPAVNWLKGHAELLQNHYHLNATTSRCAKACFLNILDVHGPDRDDAAVRREGDRLTVAGWTIECNLSDGAGTARLHIENAREGVSLDFNYTSLHGATRITEPIDGKETECILTDKLPELEI